MPRIQQIEGKKRENRSVFYYVAYDTGAKAWIQAKDIPLRYKSLVSAFNSKDKTKEIASSTPLGPATTLQGLHIFQNLPSHLKQSPEPKQLSSSSSYATTMQRMEEEEKPAKKAKREGNQVVENHSGKSQEEVFTQIYELSKKLPTEKKEEWFELQTILSDNLRTLLFKEADPLLLLLQALQIKKQEEALQIKKQEEALQIKKQEEALQIKKQEEALKKAAELVGQINEKKLREFADRWINQYKSEHCSRISLEDLDRVCVSAEGFEHFMQLESEDSQTKTTRFSLESGQQVIISNEMIDQLTKSAQVQGYVFQRHDDMLAKQKLQQSMRRFYNSSIQIPFDFDTGKPFYSRIGKVVDAGEPRTANGETISSVLQESLTKESNKIIALVGKSGCGKTTTIFSLAEKHFVLYIDCDPNKLMNLYDSLSRSFRNIERREAEKSNGNQKTFEQAVNLQDKYRQAVHYFFGRELLARLLHLRIVLKNTKNLTPRDFLDDQFNGGNKVMDRLRVAIQCIKSAEILGYCKTVIQDIKQMTGPNSFIFALDEAQIPAEKHSEIIVSQNVLIKPEGNWDAQTGQFLKFTKRGLLTLFCTTFQYLELPLIVSGTSLSIGKAASAVSAMCKFAYQLSLFTDFPSCQSPRLLLETFLDLSECESVPKEMFDRLRGRFRMAMSVVWKVVFLESEKMAKELVLRNALDNAAKEGKEYIKSDLRRFIDKSNPNLIPHFLEQLQRLVLVWKLHQGNVVWEEKCYVDLFSSCICSIESVEKENSVHLSITEPLAIEAIEELLSEEEYAQLLQGSLLVSHTNLLTNILKTLGATCSAKGNAIEGVIHQTIKGFNGKKVSELPFLRRIKKSLPKWCYKAMIKIDKIGKASEFVSADGAEGDALFLAERQKNALLVEQNQTRQDGVWFFDKEHSGSLAVKFYISNISTKIHDDNVASSDVRQSFCNQKGNVIENMEKFRNMIVQAGVNKLKGQLRIHIEIPRIACSGDKSQPETHVDNEGNVLVFIGLDNLDEFFSEEDNIFGNQMANIKQIIKTCY